MTEKIAVGFVVMRKGEPLRTGRHASSSSQGTVKLYQCIGAARRVARENGGVAVEAFVECP